MEPKKEIDWSNLDLEHRTIAELEILRKESYKRYRHPAFHLIFLVFTVLTGGVCFMMYWLVYHEYRGLVTINMSAFYRAEIIFSSLCMLMFILFIYSNRWSNKHWNEMEGIRKEINEVIANKEKKIAAAILKSLTS